MSEASTLHRDRPALTSFPGWDGVDITLLPPATRLLLRGRRGTAQQVHPALGLTLPDQPGGTVTAGQISALWLGPDEWLLLAAADQAPRLVPALEEVLRPLPHSLVDISHRQTAVQISGRKAARCLSAGCPLDLDATVFPVGRVARTLLGKAEIVLWRTGLQAFHLEVWRSFLPYVGDFLTEAARGAPDF